MIIKCLECNKYFDDEFRTTSCPHDTFSANDGKNNFKHYPGAWLNDKPAIQGTAQYREYKEWLDKSKIRF